MDILNVNRYQRIDLKIVEVEGSKEWGRMMMIM